MPVGKIIHGAEDALAAALEVLESAQEEVIWLICSAIDSRSITQGFLEKVRLFVQKGGVSRSVTQISPANVKEIQTFLDAGEDVRHNDKVHEVFMCVGDKQKSISLINIGVEKYTLDTPIVAFWSEDPDYAEYLLTCFENVWSHAVLAAQRIEELGAYGRGQR